MATDNENDIDRVRGDDYPLIITLTEDKKPIPLKVEDIVTIRVKKEDGTIATHAGAVSNVAIAEVTFDMKADEGIELVKDAGRFSYDIKVNDGEYTTTYSVAIFEVQRDLG